MTIQDFHVALQDAADDEIEALRALQDLQPIELAGDGPAQPDGWPEWPPC